MARKKWGKIGPPGSTKRKKWMRHIARIRHKHHKYYTVHLKRRGRVRVFVDGIKPRRRRKR